MAHTRAPDTGSFSTRSLVLLSALGLTLAATWYAASMDGEGDGADAADAMLARPGGPERNPDRAQDRDRNGAAAPVREPAAGAAGSAATTAPTSTLTSAPKPASRGASPAAGQRMGASVANLFAVRSWQPPPPPLRPVLAAPSAPPTAPPLPFRYLGRMEDNGRITVFLGEGAQGVRVVRQGDQLSDYRIDEINAQGMRLTYLPLQQPQQLLFGSPQ